MAHFGDTQPSKPKSVSFPICVEEKQWNDALKSWAGELKPEFQNRLRIMQPFTFVETGAFSVLKMLHDLDIQDKHKDFLTVSADLNGVVLDGAFFEYENHDAAATPRLDMKTDVKFGDGVVLGTLHAGAAIKTLGQMILRPAMKVQLTWKTRRSMSVRCFRCSSPRRGDTWTS